mmetsp:Transcript_34216/g.74964  ORF Transcript_34216/g.74964 Transcript_34216/m.74964 type:complete len:219 (-) Transcript_34216:4125-4781(-)
MIGMASLIGNETAQTTERIAMSVAAAPTTAIEVVIDPKTLLHHLLCFRRSRKAPIRHWAGETGFRETIGVQEMMMMKEVGLRNHHQLPRHRHPFLFYLICHPFREAQCHRREVEERVVLCRSRFLPMICHRCRISLLRPRRQDRRRKRRTEKGEEKDVMGRIKLERVIIHRHHPNQQWQGAPLKELFLYQSYSTDRLKHCQPMMTVLTMMCPHLLADE